jgi:hypothetical protein
MMGLRTEGGSAAIIWFLRPVAWCVSSSPTTGQQTACQHWHQGMPHKTTMYLPDELKATVEGEARRRGVSEAEVTRQAIAGAVARPRPRFGIIDGEPMAERVEELLAGFGER